MPRNQEMGGNPEIATLIDEIKALQESLGKAKNQEEAEQIQAQLAPRMQRAHKLGII